MSSEDITKYEVMFAARTGVTIMLAKNAVLDAAAHFHVSPDNPRDVVVSAGKKAVTLKNLRQEHVEAAVSRGFIMFYEMEDDEVVRCTPCNYQKI